MKDGERLAIMLTPERGLTRCASSHESPTTTSSSQNLAPDINLNWLIYYYRE